MIKHAHEGNQNQHEDLRSLEAMLLGAPHPLRPLSKMSMGLPCVVGIK